MTGWATAWAIARRDLSARFRGLRLLLVCLFLGVGALSAIGTLTGAIEQELSSRGRTILGGDIEVAVWQRAASAQERAAFAEFGPVSGGLRMQAMARAGELAAPVELKAVEPNWPLVGRLALKDGRLLGAPAPGTAWLAEGAAERLGVRVDDIFLIGTATLKVGGIIADEPDRLGELTGARPALLTGDNARAAARLAAELGIDDVHAGLLPEDKVAVVRQLESAGNAVMFVGDGVNDAPAMATAHVAVAMGRTGSDLALDTADIVMARDDLAALPGILALSRRARRVVTANLVIAAVFLVVLVTWDLAGHLPLPLGVAGHEGSTVLVGLNGLRLLRNRAWPG